jgi:PGF-pre-PGF domain-containing protein
MDIIKIFRAKNRIMFSNFIASFVLIFVLAGTILPASASGIGASREISAGTVYAGGSFTVTIHIQAAQNVEALALDENLPQGWQVSQLGSNEATFQNFSTFKETTLEWIWIENLSAGAEKTITYNVSIPSNTEPGNYTLSGTISAYSVPAAPVEGDSEIVVTYPPLEALFSASPRNGTAPLTVQFTDLSPGNPDSWKWDFDGNGSIDSEEENPVYTYRTPGSYNVSLIISNTTRGNDTELKLRYITVLKGISSSGESGGNGGNGGSTSSGGGGSGGGGGSPESGMNVEFKEISSEQVFKGTHTSFKLKAGDHGIVAVEFDPQKSFGKTITIIELLKGTSSTVKESAPGIVYKNINIWVGNSGFSSPENLENASINFRVSRAWMLEHNLNESTITMYRYSGEKWNLLPTSFIGEDKDYFYFVAKTPGFSPFAITSVDISKQPSEFLPSKGEINNNILNQDIMSGEGNQVIPDSENEKEENFLGLEFVFAAAGLLTSYAVLRGRK